MANVAIVVTNACSPDPRVERHAKWLSELGHNVIIHAWDRKKLHPTQETKNGYQIFRHGPVLSEKNNLFQIWNSKKKFLANLKINADLIVLNDSDTYGVKFNCKMILDMHDLSHSWPLMKGNSILHRIASNLMLRRCKKLLHKSDLILTSSPGITKWIKSLGYNSHTVMNYRTTVSSTNTRNKKAVGYFGRIRNTESIQKLIFAADKVDFKVILAGNGQCVEEILSDFPNVDYRGGFNEEDLDILMKEISVMYAMYPPNHLNIKQGAIAVKMLDAAAYGICSVVSMDTPMAIFGEENEICLSADFYDVDDIADAIKKASQISVKKQFKEDRDVFVELIESLEF